MSLSKTGKKRKEACIRRRGGESLFDVGEKVGGGIEMGPNLYKVGSKHLKRKSVPCENLAKGILRQEKPEISSQGGGSWVEASCILKREESGEQKKGKSFNEKRGVPGK